MKFYFGCLTALLLLSNVAAAQNCQAGFCVIYVCDESFPTAERALVIEDYRSLYHYPYQSINAFRNYSWIAIASSMTGQYESQLWYQGKIIPSCEVFFTEYETRNIHNYHVNLHYDAQNDVITCAKDAY